MIKAQLVEFWMPVKGRDDYLISDKGRVKSLNYNRTGEVRILVGKHYAKSRYTIVTIGGKTRLNHVLVAESFIGPKPAGMQVNHKDGNRHNNSWSNLEYVTASENKLHAHRLGLAPCQKGESNNNAKLDADKVREIRRLKSEGLSQAKIASIFNVCNAAVGDVIRRKNWAHVA